METTLCGDTQHGYKNWICDAERKAVQAQICQAVYDWCSRHQLTHTHCVNGRCIVRGDVKDAELYIYATKIVDQFGAKWTRYESVIWSSHVVVVKNCWVWSSARTKKQFDSQLSVRLDCLTERGGKSNKGQEHECAC